MRKEELICIICPNGCELSAEIEDAPDGIHVKEVHGSLCAQGKEWVRSELENPVRTLTTSVLCSGGNLPLVS
ncbi:MAG: DUF1667 domain-containing protein, partial [Spirochaetota bacterium]